VVHPGSPEAAPAVGVLDPGQPAAGAAGVHHGHADRLLCGGRPQLLQVPGHVPLPVLHPAAGRSGAAQNAGRPPAAVVRDESEDGDGVTRSKEGGPE
jgi:hypothetical protein